MSYIKAIFDSIWSWFGWFSTKFWDLIARVRWFFIAVFTALLVPLGWILSWFEGVTQSIKSAALGFSESVTDLGLSNVSAWWGSLASATALANCLIPLDFAIQTGGVLLSLLVIAAGVKLVQFIWRNIPGKFS